MLQDMGEYSVANVMYEDDEILDTVQTIPFCDPTCVGEVSTQTSCSW